MTDEPGRFTITGSGLRLRDVTDTVDVLMDGQRIWSIGPDAGRTGVQGWRTVAWPDSLLRFLAGSALVSLRVAATGLLLGEVEHRFSSAAGRVEVTDRRGHPLVVTKWGRASYAFGDLPASSRARWVDTVARLLDTLTDECGLQAFVSYGTLLGAVRDGAFIGHDVDADVSYLSRYEHPADVIRESYVVERRLRAAGWRVRRASGAFLQVIHRDGAGHTRNLDIFTSFFVGDVLYEDFAVGAPLARSAVLPLSSVTLEGRRLPAPADPPVILEATYGPGWSVPDPGFAYAVPRSTRSRLSGWFGGYKDGRREWAASYGARRPADESPEPSGLARLLHRRAPADALVVDVGCGAGIDADWLARQGRHVLGLDYAPSAVRHARASASTRRTDFAVLNLADSRQVLARGALLGRGSGPVVVIARQVADVIGAHARENLWRLCRLALDGGGSAYVEVRASTSDGPPGLRHRPVPTSTMRAELEASGATVEEIEPDVGDRRQGDGSTTRVVATWQPRPAGALRLASVARSVRSRG